MTQPGREKLTVPRAAARLGVKPKTFTAYVSRAKKAAAEGRSRPTDAPQPDGYFDGRTPWWWDTTIDGWNRPGQGARSDRAEQGKQPARGDLRDSGAVEQDTVIRDGVAPPAGTLH